MELILICMIPVCIIATGFLVLKSVQLGLRWQIQASKQEQPELKSPIEKVAEAIQDNKTEKMNKEREQFIKEYSPFQ